MDHSRRTACGPEPVGTQIADIGGGSFGAITGILAAVIHRQATGKGQLVDISMLDMAIAWQAHAISNYLVSGKEPTPESEPLNGGSFYDTYETEDGRYLSVGSLEPKFWQGFCEALNRPDLIGRGLDQSPENQHSLKAEIAGEIGKRPLAFWQSLFADKDVCVEPVLTIPEMLDHPQVQARHMIVAVPKPDGGTQQQIASPFKFSSGEAEYRWVGTAVGQHTEEILQEVGCNFVEINQFRHSGF